MLLIALLACTESRIPEGALFYDVTVTTADVDDDNVVDSCHPDAQVAIVTENYRYAVFFDAERAEVYVGEELFAVGSIGGCRLQYQTVVVGEESDADGDVKWQLFGSAALDPGDDACVEGDGDWLGSEVFEIVSSENDTLSPGCTYEMETTGTFVPME
jgi:hypothetical protein